MNDIVFPSAYESATEEKHDWENDIPASQKQEDRVD